jgi:hypothetical protein
MVLYKSLLTKWYLQNPGVPQSENKGSRQKFYYSAKMNTIISETSPKLFFILCNKD